MDAKRLEDIKESYDRAMQLYTGRVMTSPITYWETILSEQANIITELISEVRRLSQRNHSCECSEDEACAHVRRAEKAEAEVERLQAENAKLKNENERLYEAADSPYTAK